MVCFVFTIFMHSLPLASIYFYVISYLFHVISFPRFVSLFTDLLLLYFVCKFNVIIDLSANQTIFMWHSEGSCGFCY